jgi:hypothetical protein
MIEANVDSARLEMHSGKRTALSFFSLALNFGFAALLPFADLVDLPDGPETLLFAMPPWVVSESPCSVLSAVATFS